MKRKREKYGQIGLPPDEWFAEGGNLKARKKRVRGKRPRRFPMRKRKTFSYSGRAYLRPCDRGICLYASDCTDPTTDPMPALEGAIATALGLSDGDFAIRVTARVLPSGVRPRKAK